MSQSTKTVAASPVGAAADRKKSIGTTPVNPVRGFWLTLALYAAEMRPRVSPTKVSGGVPPCAVR